MNEFDQFVKHDLKVKNYARYTDDFIIVSEDEDYLKSLLPSIQDFLQKELQLELHPNKVVIKKYHQGIDFLGYTIFPHHRLVRTNTKRRIRRNLKKKVGNHKAGIIAEDRLNQSLQSYLGVLSHADTFNEKERLMNDFWFWLKE